MTVPEALAVLNLTLPVSESGIRKAFRNKARLYHPDMHTDPELQREAASKFIRVKDACDFLLATGISQINAGTYRKFAPVRRTTPRKTAYKKPRPESPHPLQFEIERVARLFSLINREGKKTRFWKWITGIRFVPSELLGAWYMRLIERKYPAEEHYRKWMFLLIRFIRLLSGSILLIGAFFFISISALALMVVLAPPLLLFLIFYQGYAFYLNFFQKWSKKNGRWIFPGIRDRELQYLILRSIPMIPWLAFAELFLLFGLDVSLYLQSITWIFSVLLILLLLSLGTEWHAYFKNRPIRRNS